jgi:hypothetical protein
LLFQQNTHLCLRRSVRTKIVSSYLPETNEKHTTLETISAATRMLCCGAICCQLKRQAIQRTAIQLRNVDRALHPVRPDSTVRSANRQIRYFLISFSLKVKANSSAVQELLWARLSLSRRIEWERNRAGDKDVGG